MKPSFVVRLSGIDEERFGFRIAKAANIRLGDIPTMLQFCRREYVELLIARCSVEELDAVHAMGRVGFDMMDTLVYFVFYLDGAVTSASNAPLLPIRAALPDEEHLIIDLAYRCFHDYMGHYHSDPRLNRRDCDLAYADWAKRLYQERSAVSDVLVATHEDTPVGFLTLRLNTPAEGEIVLNAVDPSTRNRGVYTSLVQAGIRWCSDMGASRLLVSTQITNIPVQRIWSRLGFVPHSASYTFHKWAPASERISE